MALALKLLRRNDARRKVAEYFLIWAPVGAILLRRSILLILYSPLCVIGVIRGMKTRHNENKSFPRSYIAEMKSGGKDIKWYGITPFGREIIAWTKGNMGLSLFNQQ